MYNLFDEIIYMYVKKFNYWHSIKISLIKLQYNIWIFI